MTSYFLNDIRCLRSFSEHKIKIIFSVLLAGLLFTTWSCEDPPSLTGSKMLPGTDFVTIESSLLKVKSYTMYRDSVSSGMPTTSYLGSVFDPYFGTTTCEFVSQIRLGAEWFDGNFYIDSVKLFLKLLSVKGDTADQHFLRLSEISDIIYNDSSYYSNQAVPVTSWSIEDIELPALRADTVNDVEMRVDNFFAGYIFRDTSQLKYTSTVDFRKYFRGLYFQMISPNDPILVSLSCASPAAYGYYSNYFEVYGHDDYATAKTFTLILDAVSTNASFNRYYHDPSTATAALKIQHINDTNYKDTVTYSQQFNGVFTKLVLSSLDSIKNAPGMKNISVNKARLKIPIVYEHPYYTRTNIPSNLYLRYLTTTGSRYYVPETGTSFFDGTADTTADSEYDDVYNLNIATFVQGYLEDETNEVLPELELFLLPSAGSNVILRANNSYKPIKFEFTYTKF
jgi:hypothetical protein